MAKLPNFRLEEYFAKHEFSAPHLLCASDCEAFTMKEILDLADDECRALWDQLSLQYTETAGLPLLRQEIAAQYDGIASDQVLCTCGAEEGIYLTMRSLLSERDHVIVVTPCYQSLYEPPRRFAGDVTCVELDPANQWKLDLDAVKEAIRPNTKLIVMNFPHNPTGALPSLSEMHALIELARSNDIYLLNDEVYRLMEIDPQDRLPAIAEIYEKGVSIGVMTKAYGLAGLRIGWIATRDSKALKGAAEAKHYTSICNAAPSEILALIALRNASKLLARNHELMLENRKRIEQLIARYPQRLTWVAPKGGCIGFMHLNAEVDMDTFADQLREETGVLILPASIYDYPGNYFRIGYGRANMEEAFSRFEAFLSRLDA